jgi:hypothetical protein
VSLSVSVLSGSLGTTWSVLSQRPIRSDYTENRKIHFYKVTFQVLVPVSCHVLRGWFECTVISQLNVNKCSTTKVISNADTCIRR